MVHNLFPKQIETRRLVFERVSHETIDPFEFYEFVTRDDWQSATAEHMPWFRFQRLDQVTDFIDRAEQQWADHTTARYLLRPKDEEGELIGTTAYGPEWDTRRAGSGVVLAKQYWGREYGVERASAFIELTFERYDLDAYYTTCAVNNDPSRRMIEKYVEKYGGRHEGLLRQHSPHPNDEVTDQHRFTIVRSEYEDVTTGVETLDFNIDW
ncbi:GNAT family protein [Halorubrum sp. AD140]|uniref:GNAT family N-acetyltransferase n=1 Tax=Halorubrum sp. AD140 TaxID=3050073 RepID=UPI002ACCBBAA|nr:GNAT family protein [Halorubrum sp. AD140]MDZ5810651.1 GNAT family protein [Halorubrum sp. AD140]MDZ5810792.1 GNAT family protein [Halorubrum sp. AD140]